MFHICETEIEKPKKRPESIRSIQLIPRYFPCVHFLKDYSNKFSVFIDIELKKLLKSHSQINFHSVGENPFLLNIFFCSIIISCFLHGGFMNVFFCDNQIRFYDVEITIMISMNVWPLALGYGFVLIIR